MQLKLHYKGQGIYTNDVVQVEKDISNMYYQGEKRPMMYWLKFEQRLTNAFATLVRHEG